MGTVHANSPYDALVRLETLAMLGDTRVPESSIRRQISSAIHIVVQIKRLADGSRKITSISEVIPELDDRNRYQLQEIYAFRQQGRTKEGKILGEMVPTGVIPQVMRDIEINALPFGRDKFAPKKAA
jgi:pilus assembly protein CpaF